MTHHHFGQKKWNIFSLYSVTVVLTIFYFQLGKAQISIGAIDVPYTQDFNTLVSTGSSTTLPAGWALFESAGNAEYMANNGNSNIADTYSYGSTGATDRALGMLDNNTMHFGAHFINNTGLTVTSILIQFTGEQWRLGDVGIADRLDFQYSTDATALTNGTWNNYNLLDFIAPVTTGSVGALNGNLEVNRTPVGSIFTGLSIPDNTTFWIRWTGPNIGGAEDGLAVDDFVLTANPPALHYTISYIGGALSITDTYGSSDELDMTQVGTDIRFYAPGRTFSLNSGATTPFPADISLIGMTSIVINAAVGNDTIDVGGFSATLPLFTINGGIGDDVVNMNGDIGMSFGSPFNADLVNDANPPGIDKFIVAANANIVCFGTGIATVKASHSILLNSGSSIVTMDGNMVIEANQLPTPTTGNFIGLQLNTNAFLEVTGAGTATIKGKGGTTGASNIGIFLSGGTIKGGMAGAPLTINGNGGLSSGNGNHGVSLTGALAAIRTIGGNVNITGIAGGTGASAANYGLHCVNNAAITTAGGTGNVTVNGTGGNCTGGNNMGVWVGVAAMIISGSGNVNVTGTGGGGSGSGTHNYGVFLVGGGKITCGGSGSVTVNGTGGTGTGSANDGVTVYEPNSLITSSGGAVNVTGQGGGMSTSGANVGVHLQGSGTISAGGAGTVTVTGTGGSTSGVNNFGIFVIDNGTAITSSGGSVTLVGEGGGSGSSSNNYGIVVFNGLVTNGGTGAVSLTGTGGTSAGTGNIGIFISEVNGTVTSSGGSVTLTGIEGSGPNGYSISVVNSGSVSGGTLNLIGNSINIAGPVQPIGTSAVTIRPYTNAVDVFLGPATNIIGGPLHLSDAELDFVSYQTINIGNINTGDITVSSSITRSVFTNIGLVSGDNVTIDGGNINANGGNVVLDSGPGSDAIRPVQTGNDLTCGLATTQGALSIVIDGLVPDVSYTQLDLIGVINLNNAPLVLSGTYDPQPNDVFTIVNNDDTDAVFGTFTGLAQGATIPAFLGSDYPATISYTGGTGNDVVITVMDPDYIITTAGNNLVITDAAGNSENLTASQNGANIRFLATGRNFSLNGAVLTAMPADVAISGLQTVTINTAIGNDGITINAFQTSLPSLTINGGVGDDNISFIGDINFIIDASLDANMQNDDASPGNDQISFTANANIILSGNGNADLKVSRNISFNSNTSLEVVNGFLTLEANQQPTPTTGTFTGISLATNSVVRITGSGILSVKGKGGTSLGNQNGIAVNSGDLIGGTSGTTIIEGYGGATTLNTNVGVSLTGAGASITTNGSHLQVTGVGGGADDELVNLGVSLSSNTQISAGSMGNVTILGIGGNTSGSGNEGIRIAGVGSQITSSGGNVSVTGMGGGTGLSAIGVSLIGTNVITAGGLGTVTVSGTGGSGATSNQHGITIAGGATITSNGGDVEVNGNGGGTGIAQGAYGVFITSGTITAGGSGNVHVAGNGGTSLGDSKTGIYLTLATSSITSGGGHIVVEGIGGGATQSFLSCGVQIESGATIQSGGNGDVHVTGIGSPGTGNNNHGVVVRTNDAKISSSGGDVIVVGTGGSTSGQSGNFNVGVAVESTGRIFATGAGTVSITGTGGGGNGTGNYGVNIFSPGSFISSAGGEIIVAGVGGSSGMANSNKGVYMFFSGAIFSLASANISIQGTGGMATGNLNHGVELAGDAAIHSAGGNITITGTGMGAGTSANNKGVYAGSSNTITTTGAGNITIDGTGGVTSGSYNAGIELLNTTLSTVDGDILFTGTGGGQAASGYNYGISLAGISTITSLGTGNITMTANSGNSNGGTNIGMILSDATTGLFTTSGNIIIEATGYGYSTNAANTGLIIQAGSKVLAGASGNINIIGTGGQGAGSGHFGVFVNGNGSLITSLNGDIGVAGFGGLGSGSNNGVYLSSGGHIESSGNGDITIEGHGGIQGSSSSLGVLLTGPDAEISSSSGNIDVTGFGGGSAIASDYNYGVFIFNQSRIVCGDTLMIEGTGGQGMGIGNVGFGMTTEQNQIIGGGPVIINGIEGGGTSGFGLLLDADATITTDSLGGNITLVANSILSSATIETPGSNSVTIRPYTAGVSIHLGVIPESIGGPLRLSDPELDFIHTGHLRIGHTQTDSILVLADITRNDTLDITLLAGGDIVLDTGAIMMNSGNLLLDCGPSPKAIMPLTHGTEIVTDTLSFGSDLLFNIDGIIPDSLHDQLRVNGRIKLTGVDLKFSGSYLPLYADTFLIVVNDSTDAIIGTFNGLAEGATIPMFLGSNTPATITYTGGDGNDVVITVSTPDYSITESAGHLVVTDLKNNSDNMTVSQSGSNIRFLVTSRIYSYNYGAFTTMPADIPLAGIDSITINLTGGNDLMTFNTFSSPFPQVTLNGGTGNDTISFAGDITFIPDADLFVDLQDDDASPGTDQVIVAAGANLEWSGSGSATVKVSRSVLMNAGSGLETVNGNIVIESNMQSTPSTGTFVGIDMDGAFCKTTGTGNILLEGKGGTTTSGRHGVQVRNGSSISCEATGMITVEGTGGASNQSSNYGVNIGGANSIITAAGNVVSVTGTGGGMTATVDNTGIVLQSGGKIATTGSADLLISASGSTFGGGNNGMMILGAGSGVFTVNGDITVTTQANGASNSSNNLGLLIFNQGVIQSAGTGNVEVTATGGIGSGTGQLGVSLATLNSGIFSTDGNLTVNGNGGGSATSNASNGVRIISGAAIAALGTGHVIVNALGGPGSGSNNSGLVMQILDSRISSNGGNISVTGTGGGSGSSVSTLGISMTSGSKINATSGGNILLHATGGQATGSSNFGLSVLDADILTSDGNITIQAMGGGSGSSGSNIGMSLGSTALIHAGGAGQVLIEATGGPGSGIGNNGAELLNAGTLITTDGGNLQMTCTGGGASGSANNFGLSMQTGSIVRAGGNGQTMVTGIGGLGESQNNTGIRLAGTNTKITSEGGNVIVNGSGGGSGVGSSSLGVYLESGGTITAELTGNVMVTGTGGPGTGLANQGILVSNPLAAITSGGGDIEIIAIEGGGPSGIGFVTLNSGTVSTDASGGNISIAANSMMIQSALATSAADTFFIKPLDAGLDVQLSISGDPIGGPLQLTDTELDFITTGTLVIGDSLSSDVRVLANVTRPAATSVWFTTGGDISFQTGSVNTQGGNLACSPGISPAAITAQQTGVDVTVDTLKLNGICSFTVDGTAYDMDYEQLHVAGKVDVDSVNIVLSGMYVPVVGDSFMFIRNDGSDLLIGAIAGWADGDTLSNFLGSSLGGLIDYSGGDGNDLVVRVVQPCILPEAPMIALSADTICAGQQVTLTITGGDLGQATDWHWYASNCGTNPIGTGASIMVTPLSSTTYFARGEGGCVVTADCGEGTVIANPYPDAAIERSASGDCYYTTNTFLPFASEIPGATYEWTFGSGATPASATGYGPHDVLYTIAGPKSAKLVIQPNAPGAQCPDSTTLIFSITSCPGQILGRVESISGAPIASTIVKLYADADANGIADNTTALRSVFTSSTGAIAMAVLTPGHYVLIETQPTGWTSFDDGDSTSDGDLVPNIDSLDNSIPVSIIPSETDSMNVFVERPTPGSISGAVFQDLDFDQMPDSGEGLSEVTLRLHPDANTDGIADGPMPVDTLVTVADGLYVFSDVPVGHYVVVEVQPASYINIKDFDQSNDLDQVPNSNMLNDTIPVTITNGETDSENYFIDSPTCGSVVTNTNDSGPGSLRELLGCAQSGDTIRFHSSLAGMVIEINSAVIQFNQDVVLFSELSPRLMISSQIDGLFEIQSTADVTFIDLDIRSGLSPGMTGAAIENEGILTLVETNILKNPFFVSGEYLIRNMPGSQITIEGVCLIMD